MASTSAALLLASEGQQLPWISCWSSCGSHVIRADSISPSVWIGGSDCVTELAKSEAATPDYDNNDIDPDREPVEVEQRQRGDIRPVGAMMLTIISTVNCPIDESEQRKRYSQLPSWKEPFARQSRSRAIR